MPDDGGFFFVTYRDADTGTRASRPNRGKRVKVKAGRKAARRSRR